MAAPVTSLVRSTIASGGDVFGVQRAMRIISGDGREVHGRWKLDAREIRVSIESRYQLRDITFEYPTTVNTFTALASAQASAMPGTPDPRRVSFGAEFWAQDNSDDIRPTADALTRLVSFVPALNRRPLVEVSWAGFALEGWMEITGISYVEGVFDAPPFLPRAFRVAITVTQAQQPRLQSITGDAIQGETRFQRLGSYDSFEAIAMRTLGDPMLGVLLRRINTQLRAGAEQPGDVIKVLERNHPLMGESTEPAAPPFVGDYRGYVEELAEERLSKHFGPGLERLETELGL